MVGDTHIELDIAQTLSAIGALFVVAGIPALIAARRTKHNTVRIASTAQTVDDIADKVATQNGNDIGGLVEQTHKDLRAVSRLLEVVDGRVHDLSKRLDNQGNELGAVHQHQAAVEAQLIAQGDRIEEAVARFEEVAASVEEHHSLTDPLIKTFISEHQPKGE